MQDHPEEDVRRVVFPSHIIPVSALARDTVLPPRHGLSFTRRNNQLVIEKLGQVRISFSLRPPTQTPRHRCHHLCHRIVTRCDDVMFCPCVRFLTQPPVYPQQRRERPKLCSTYLPTDLMRTRKRAAEGEQTPGSVSGGGKRQRGEKTSAVAAPVDTPKSAAATSKSTAAAGGRPRCSRAAAKVGTAEPAVGSVQGASGSSSRAGSNRPGDTAKTDRAGSRKSTHRLAEVSNKPEEPVGAKGKPGKGASKGSVKPKTGADTGTTKRRRSTGGDTMATREELEAMREEAYDHDDLDQDEEEEEDDVDEDEEDEDEEEGDEEDGEDSAGDEDDPTGLQALLRRLGGGLEDLLPNAGHVSGKLKQILVGLKADGDDIRQIAALNELCEVLVISSEESLITLSVDSFVPVLVNLMQAEHNPDAMLLAARALTSMADILPNSRGAIIHHGALPAFCSRLLTIEYIDLAEQSLQALEKLSQDHGGSCLREGGMMACLSYLDFFSLGMQRVALQTAANICRQLPASDCWDQLSDSVPVLTNLLMHDDSRLVESACTCLTLMASNFSARPQRLQAMCAHGLIPNATRLISPGASQVGPSTYHGLIRLIGTCCRGSADVVEELLRNGMATTLKTVLAGCKILATSAASPASPVVSADQILEVTTLANQLLPAIRPESGGCAKNAPFAALGIAPPPPTTARRKSTESGEAAGQATAAAGVALETVMRDEPKLLTEYGANLTALLMQVTTSSVGTNVKLQCLSALAKFMHHAPPEMLAEGEAALNPGQMASFLAGLASVRDAVMKEKYSVVEVALYLIESLMHKLPDTFRRAFRKEGTVHAVEMLCAQQFDAETTAVAAAAKAMDANTGGNITPRDQVVPSGIGSGSAASIVARMVLAGQGSGRKPSETPQRRAAVKRAIALRAAHFASVAETEAESRLRTACGPLRAAGEDPIAAANIAVDFVAALLEGEGASTFELLECGGVEALRAFFSGADLPQDDGWSAAVAARLSSFTHAAAEKMPSNAMGALVELLLDALAVTESLPMRLSASKTAGATPSAGRNPGAGDGLSVLARPFKLRLARSAENKEGLRDYNSNIILVEPLATLNAIEDFLYPRVHKPAGTASTPDAGASGSGGDAAAGAGARRSTRSSLGQKNPDGDGKEKEEEDEEDEEIDEDEMIAEAEEIEDEDDDGMPRADTVEDVDPSRNGDADASASASAAETSRPSARPTAAAAATAAPPRLLFSASGAGPFHPSTSVLQAVYAAALAAADAEAGEEGAGARMSVASLWERTQTLTYMLTPKGEPIPAPLSGAGGSVAPVESTVDADEALAVFGSTDRRAALGAAFPALRGKVCGDSAPPGVAEQTDAILSALAVLRVLTSFPARVISLGHDDADAKESSTRAASVALPADAFVSTKLAGKMVRQLGDTLSLCSGSLPAWCVALARTCPFLFPFETRQQLFYCTTFGLARALHRMHGQSENTGGGQDLRVGRLQRQKVRVSRERILESAVKVFDMAPAHKMVLEVEFFDEVGTGTGPTLEFYTLLSKELGSRSLGAWRDADSRSVEETAAKEPVTAPHGLFPAPMAVSTSDAAAPKSPGGLKRLDLFRLLGRVVGKALQDSRLLDVGLSPTFYRAAVGNAALALPDVAAIDPALGRTLATLAAAAKQMAKLRASGAPEHEWRAVTVDGAAISDLCLSFTLPGDDAFELRPGGADVTVDVENVGEYVDAVVDATVGGGVARQLEAFRSGLRDICRPDALGVFSEAELERVLCGEGQAWTPELLSECVTFDHGYAVSSPPIQALMEVLCSYSADEQKAFLRFVTGAPRLPPGGLAALQPKLTVVCKQPSGAAGGAARADGQPISHGTTLADMDLPSAMTCASYLKLPPYSCVEVLRERLGYAVNEGVGSFDLS